MAEQCAAITEDAQLHCGLPLRVHSNLTQYSPAPGKFLCLNPFAATVWSDLGSTHLRCRRVPVPHPVCGDGVGGPARGGQVGAAAGIPRRERRPQAAHAAVVPGAHAVRRVCDHAAQHWPVLHVRTGPSCHDLPCLRQSRGSCPLMTLAALVTTVNKSWCRRCATRLRPRCSTPACSTRASRFCLPWAHFTRAPR